jgi:hypothetical protein
MQRPDLATLACVNPECQYFGRPHQDNLTIRVFFPAPRLCSIPLGQKTHPDQTSAAFTTVAAIQLPQA